MGLQQRFSLSRTNLSNYVLTIVRQSAGLRQVPTKVAVVRRNTCTAIVYYDYIRDINEYLPLVWSILLTQASFGKLTMEKTLNTENL